MWGKLSFFKFPILRIPNCLTKCADDDGDKWGVACLSREHRQWTAWLRAAAAIACQQLEEGVQGKLTTHRLKETKETAIWMWEHAKMADYVGIWNPSPCGVYCRKAFTETSQTHSECLWKKGEGIWWCGDSAQSSSLPMQLSYFHLPRPGSANLHHY